MTDRVHAVALLVAGVLLVAARPGGAAPGTPGSRAAGPGTAAAPAVRAPGSPPAIAARGPFRLLESDAGGVTLDYVPGAPVFTDTDTPFGRFQAITIPDHASPVDLGRPALPSAGVGVALPEGVEGRLTVEVLSTEERPGVRPLPSFEGPVGPAPVTRRDGAAIDESVYGGTSPWPRAAVTFTELGRLRNHRVGQVAVTPVRFDPARGSVSVITRARIRVDFVPSRKPPAKGAAVPRVPVGEEKAWEDLYEGAFLNYAAARSFRTRPIPVPALRAGAGLASSGGSGNAEFRIYVGKTGLYGAAYSDLGPLGWPADIPIGRIHFYEKAWNEDDPATPLVREIPIQVEEAGTPDSLFNGDDVFYFYGLNYRDRFQQSFSLSRFTDLHVYWLSWGDAPAPRMDVVSGWYDAPSVTTPKSYVQHTRREEDVRYIFIRPLIGGYERFPELDTHYWLDAASYRDSLTFSTPGRDPAGPVRLRATWQGVFLGTHYVSLWLTRGSAGAVSDTLLLFKMPFGPQTTYTYDSGYSLAGTRLADGDNRIRIQGNGFNPSDPNTEGSGAYFDGFDVDYHRFYAAKSGFLRFTSGTARGDVEFAVRGLSVPDVVVFDVTDSLAPFRVAIAPERVTQIVPPPRREYEVRFRAPVDGQRTYVIHSVDAIPPVTAAVATGRMPPDLGTKNVQEDEPFDVLSDRGADVIVLAHPSLAAALAPWKARREAPPYNHHVWIVSPQDVWDQFSGGHKSVPAIREWLRYVYRNWATPPDDLVLFGDANEDYRKLTGSSDADWVPTMMLYGPVNGPDTRLELVGSDNYYVGSLAAGDADDNVFPEMHVGRLSPGSPAEAEALVAKLLAYDDYTPGDAWRKRGLLVSDDRYSTPVTSNGLYDFSPSESLFAGGADSLSRTLERRSCYTGFTCEQYRLEEIMDRAPCNLGRTYQVFNYPDLGVNIDCAKRYASPEWVNQSSRGHLFQIYSGHGNRFVMGTERFVEFTGNFTPPEYRTPELLTNYGKPFIYFGIGCHLNEYESFQEQDTKASLGEEMVLLPGRGAIASFGSTGYEWVSTNPLVEVYIGRSVFADYPVDPVEGPRRILGEGVDAGLARLAIELGGGADRTSVFRDCLATYCLLGDPTMRIDMAPPALQVTVDGEPVTSGDNVRPAPGATSIAIRATVSDDVTYGADGFSITENGVPVPPANYTLTPTGNAAAGSCRGAVVEYRAGTEASRYPLVLSARDWVGRDITFTLNLKMDVAFYGNGKPLHPGDLVPVDAPVEIRVQSANPLEPGDFTVRMNGEDGRFAVSGTGGEWTAENEGELPEGQLVLEAVVKGRPLTSLTVQARKSIVFTEAYFYPNPWEGHGAGRFIYQLSYPSGETPRGLQVTVFTVSGRKVATLEGPVETGRNSIAWDMKDSRGDGVANGVYLFRMVLETASGRKISTLDRLVVHR